MDRISTEWFHDYYCERYGQLNTRKATSLIMYTNVLRLFFQFIKQKLYAGYTFMSPIGEFRIVKIYVTTDKKFISFAGIVKEETDRPSGVNPKDWIKKLSQDRIIYRNQNKPYFYTLRFTPISGLEERYKFKPLQTFVRKIHEYYD